MNLFDLPRDIHGMIFGYVVEDWQRIQSYAITCKLFLQWISPIAKQYKCKAVKCKIRTGCVDNYEHIVINHGIEKVKSYARKHTYGNLIVHKTYNRSDRVWTPITAVLLHYENVCMVEFIFDYPISDNLCEHNSTHSGTNEHEYDSENLFNSIGWVLFYLPARRTYMELKIDKGVPMLYMNSHNEEGGKDSSIKHIEVPDSFMKKYPLFDLKFLHSAMQRNIGLKTMSAVYNELFDLIMDKIRIEDRIYTSA